MLITESYWNGLAEYRDTLEHSGRKGMKWYQHIFGDYQDHAKYAKGSSGQSDNKKTRKELREDKRLDAAREKAKKKREDAKKKKEAAAKKELERKAKILSNPTQLYKHRKEFTYDEINKAMKTFEWEKKLNQYSQDQLKRGADYINTLNTYANNGINLYNSAARIVNALKKANNDKDLLPYVEDIGGKKDKKDKKNDNQQNNNNKKNKSKKSEPDDTNDIDDDGDDKKRR